MCKDGMDIVRKKLKEMYEKGRSLQWKIPTEDSSQGGNTSQEEDDLPLNFDMDDITGLDNEAEGEEWQEWLAGAKGVI